MEDDIEAKIQRFIGAGTGFDYGYGSGYGSGCGFGSGSGFVSDDGFGSDDGKGYGSGQDEESGSGFISGDGDGAGIGYGSNSGVGYGDGTGFGYGTVYKYGYGLKTYNDNPVYYIDGKPTIINQLHGNIAEGFYIQSDLTLLPCFVAKVGDCFAHGSTAHKAILDAKAKYEKKKPLEERINDFVELHPDIDSICSCSYLFAQHHVLTGSCEMGRRLFCKEHGIDIEHDSMTVRQFIELTRDDYGGAAIKMLESRYKRGQS